MCPHVHREYFRHPQQPKDKAIQRCMDCGANARGAGQWVSHLKLLAPVETLPIDPWLGRGHGPQIVTQQVSLFRNR